MLIILVNSDFYVQLNNKIIHIASILELAGCCEKCCLNFNASIIPIGEDFPPCSLHIDAVVIVRLQSSVVSRESKNNNNNDNNNNNIIIIINIKDKKYAILCVLGEHYSKLFTLKV